MASLPHNDKVEFHEVPDLNHFSVLAPATKMIADKLKSDVDPAGKVEFTDADFANLKAKLSGSDERCSHDASRLRVAAIGQLP
jgi:hypothetical protein